MPKPSSVLEGKKKERQARMREYVIEFLQSKALNEMCQVKAAFMGFCHALLWSGLDFDRIAVESQIKNNGHPINRVDIKRWSQGAFFPLIIERERFCMMVLRIYQASRRSPEED